MRGGWAILGPGGELLTSGASRFLVLDSIMHFICSLR